MLILAIDLSDLGVGSLCGWISRRVLGLWGVGGRNCVGGVLRLSVGGRICGGGVLRLLCVNQAERLNRN